MNFIREAQALDGAQKLVDTGAEPFEITLLLAGFGIEPIQAVAFLVRHAGLSMHEAKLVVNRTYPAENASLV